MSVVPADWKVYSVANTNYDHVIGILMGTRYMIEHHSKHNVSEIEMLHDLIVTSVVTFRSPNG